MMRSLFAGVTGLRTHQTRMDVLGNNISNVNTVGYKKSVANFADLYSDTLSSAQAPTGTNGSVNAKQIGLGVGMNSITTKHNQGAPQYTGNPLDLAITGEGFFVLRTPSGNQFTRAGDFKIGTTGFLENQNGSYVQGFGSMYRAGTAGEIETSNLEKITSANLQEFEFTPDANIATKPNGNYRLEVVPSANKGEQPTFRLYKNGNEVPIEGNVTIGGITGATVSNGNKITVKIPTIGTFTTTVNIPEREIGNEGKVSDAAKTALNGLKSDNLTVKFTQAENIITTPQGKYTLKATQGAKGTLPTLELMKDGQAVSLKTQPQIKGLTGTNIPVDTKFTVTVPNVGEFEMTVAAKATETEVAIGDIYDQITTMLNGATAAMTVENNDGAAGDPISADTVYTQLAGTINTVDLMVTNNDGFVNTPQMGDIQIDQRYYENVSITTEGQVVAQLKESGNPPGFAGAPIMAKGEKVILGYITLATFPNTEGLEKSSTNMFVQTPGSGQATFNLVNSNGAGGLTTSALEMSNVDLSDEMVSVITTQRGFQANSRIITVSDTLLEELINLKR